MNHSERPNGLENCFNHAIFPYSPLSVVFELWSKRWWWEPSMKRYVSINEKFLSLYWIITRHSQQILQNSKIQEEFKFAFQEHRYKLSCKEDKDFSCQCFNILLRCHGWNLCARVLKFLHRWRMEQGHHYGLSIRPTDCVTFENNYCQAITIPSCT